MVLFVNGLPLVVIELKNAADENATTRKAFDQLQTYKLQLPTLMTYNVCLVASDGITARIGTLTGGWDRFMPWRTVDGEEIAPKGKPELDVLMKGVFEQGRFLDLLRHFIVFEVDGPNDRQEDGRLSPVPRGQQGGRLHARGRVAERGPPRRRRLAHARVSGKSLTMAFYAGKVIRHPEMQNPTHRRDYRPQRPRRPTLRHVRRLPRTAPPEARAGRRPRRSEGAALRRVGRRRLHDAAEVRARSRRDVSELSDRRNIVVIADEAHRSQYGHYAKAKKTGEISYGFTKHLRDALPNASFSASPARRSNLATRTPAAVFGDYIDVYDISRAVEDGATVKIYYEGRLAKLELNADERPKIDEEFEEVTEGEEQIGQGKAQDQVGGAGSAGRQRQADQADRQGHRRPLGRAARRDGRQGDDRLHEPPNLRRAVQGTRHDCARTGTATTTKRGRSRS